MNTPYLPPTLIVSEKQTVDQFIGDWPDHTSSYLKANKPVSYDELLRGRSVCVFGEPGFGKSRLLQELYKLKIQEGQLCIFLDLKQVGTQPIIHYIKEKLTTGGSGYQRSEWSFKSSEGTNSDNLEQAYLFLDALDEVALEHIPRLLWEMGQLTSSASCYTLVTSCRTHHAERFLKDFRSISFEYCIIRPFRPDQVADYLKHCSDSLSDLTTGEIMDKLDKHYHRNGFFDWSSTLNTPRYLEYFGALLKENSFGQVAAMSRCQLFEAFIDTRFEVETAKQRGGKGAEAYARKIPYLKQCFQRVALVMEIQRTNRISKNDLASLDMDAALGISSQLSLETFYDGTIIKDSGDYLEFDNTEFQEYLAAMALSQLGRTEQVIFDLAIDERLQLVHTSWFNPFSFLIELHHDLLPSLIRFGVSAEDDGLFRLLNYAAVTAYEEETRAMLFNEVVSYHIDNKRLFADRIAGGLGKFFLPKIHEERLFTLIVGQPLTLSTFVNTTIAAEIQRAYLGQGGAPNALRKDWSKALLEQVDLHGKYGTIMNTVIFNLLPLICSQSQFEASGLQLNRTVGDVFKGCHQFYAEVAPDSKNGIDIFIAKVIADHTVGYRSPFEKITTKEGFQYLFEQLFDEKIDRELYQSTYSNHEILSDAVVTNLIKIYDDEIEQQLLTGINTVFGFRHLFGKSLPDRVVGILQSQHPDVLTLLVDNIPTLPKEHFDIEYNYGLLFARLLKDPKQIDQLAALLHTTEIKKAILKQALIHNRTKEGNSALATYFPEQLKVWEKNALLQQAEETESERRIRHHQDLQLERFRKLLSNGVSAVSTYYRGLSEEQQAHLTPVERKKLKHIVLDLLATFEPLAGKVQVEQNGDNSQRVTQTRRIINFKDALLLIPELGIDPTPYRNKILQALLFTYQDEEVVTITGLVPDLTTAEVERFTRHYGANRDDGLLQESVGRFVSLCERIEGLLQQAESLLKTWATLSSIAYFNRTRIIRLLAKELPDVPWLRTTFNYYAQQTDSEERDEILQALNLELLGKDDPEAVRWRMELVLATPYDLEEGNSISTGARWVPKYEGLGRSLGILKSRNFLSQMLWFLEESFKILAVDSAKQVYARNEVWQIVIPFLIEANLNATDQEKALKKLNELMATYGDNEQVHWFYERVTRVERTYLENRSPVDFGDAVKRYLLVRNKQYLDIGYTDEVFSLIQEVIDFDLRDWVNQGAYRFIGEATSLVGKRVDREGLIQKTIVTQLENYLLKRGFRASDMKMITPVIFREAQLLDDRRTDLVITYGAIGSVMVEIKRMGNADLRPGKLNAYKEKFLAYLQQTHCDFGIYLIFLDREDQRKHFANKLAELEALYSELNIAIIGINCLGEAA